LIKPPLGPLLISRIVSLSNSSLTGLEGLTVLEDSAALDGPATAEGPASLEGPTIVDGPAEAVDLALALMFPLLIGCFPLLTLPFKKK
jgi:hypothetical protein